MSEPIYCGLAFGSVYMNVSGNYIPCCGIVPDNYDYSVTSKLVNLSPIHKLNSYDLVKFRNTLVRGEWHPACDMCKNAEARGVESMRTTWNKVITDAPITENIDPAHVKFLNLSFGNKCNSRCMTCNSASSNQWPEEEKFIWGRTATPIKPIYDNTTNTQLIQTFPNVTTINFLGGEPTIAEEHLDFLKLLTKHRDCSVIQLQYVSNLTNLTDELIECWKNFKAIGLTVSIDGYSKVNDYMRYPFKWDKVDSNLHKYLEQTRIDPKFTVNLSCTVSMLNICSVADLIEYYVDSGHKYCQLWEGDQKLPSIMLNKVTFPDYLQSALLPLEYRLQALDRAEHVLKNVRKVTPSVTDSLATLIEWLKEPQIVDSELNQKAKHFIQQSDIFRDRNIEDYIPGLVSQL